MNLQDRLKAAKANLSRYQMEIDRTAKDLKDAENALYRATTKSHARYVQKSIEIIKKGGAIWAKKYRDTNKVIRDLEKKIKNQK